MNDSMISVKIPAGLIEELRLLAKEEYYLDVSEAVRDIIRTKWSQEQEDVKEFLKQATREDIEELLKSREVAE